LLEKSTGKTFEDTDVAEAFLKRAPIAQEIRTRIEKWDCMTLTSFCTAKETISRIIIIF
jgi:hypothetical protein